MAAFQNGALLAFDFLPRRLIQPYIVQKQGLYDLARFLADRVGIFDEFHLFGLFEYLHYAFGEYTRFVPANSHTQ